MKISYVTMQYPVPSETFCSLDIDALRKQGHELSVHGLRYKHKLHERLIQERGQKGLKVENFSSKIFTLSVFFCFRHPFMFFSLLLWIFRFSILRPRHLFKSLLLVSSVAGHFLKIYKSKPDVVHLFWGHYPSMIGYLVKRFMPKTVLSQFLGAHDLVTNYPGSICLAKDVDLLFTHSRSNLPLLENLGIDPERVNVVMRGTRLDIAHESDSEKFDQIDTPIFLTAARLIAEKGVDDVIRIFSEVHKLYPEAILNIAGDGPFKSELIRLAHDLGCANRIYFLGHIKQAVLAKIMSNSHFFILMSRYPSERLPNVLKEAMYQRCVVLTTNTPGIDELVDSGASGFVVDKGDYVRGIDLTLESLRQPDKARLIAYRGRNHIKANFDVEKSMKVYSKLWARALLEMCNPPEK